MGKLKVNETSTSGDALETTDVVEALRNDQIKFSRVCRISVPDLTDLSTATLEIDGVSFSDLDNSPPQQQNGKEHICLDTDTFIKNFDVTIPRPVRDAAKVRRQSLRNADPRMAGYAAAQNLQQPQ